MITEIENPNHLNEPSSVVLGERKMLCEVIQKSFDELLITDQAARKEAEQWLMSWSIDAWSFIWVLEQIDLVPHLPRMRKEACERIKRAQENYRLKIYQAEEVDREYKTEDDLPSEEGREPCEGGSGGAGTCQVH